MREPIDDWWQQQLMHMEMAPHKKDWEAVYTRLHGRKNRRAWWLLLLPFLMLGFAGAYVFFYDSTTDDAVTQTKKHSQDPAITTTNQSDLSKQSTTTKESSTIPPRKQSKAEVAQPQLHSVQQQSGINDTDSTLPAVNTAKATASKINKSIIKEINNSTDAHAVSIDSSKLKQYDSFKQYGDQPEYAINDATPAYANKLTATSLEPAFNFPPANVAEANWQKQIQQATIVLSAGKETSQHKTPKTGWWLWAETGMLWQQYDNIFPSAKAENNFSAPDNNNSSGIQFSNGYQLRKKGYHAGVGMLWRKPIGKRMALSIGTGLRYAAWQEGGDIYRDSIGVNGTINSRTVVGDYALQYRYAGMVVPILMEGRIGRQNNNSFGWSAGLVNQFVIKLNATSKSNLLPVFSSMAPEVNVAKPKATAWQTGMQPGFYWEHNRKSNFRVQPTITIPINPMATQAQTGEKYFPIEASVKLMWRLQ